MHFSNMFAKSYCETFTAQIGYLVRMNYAYQRSTFMKISVSTMEFLFKQFLFESHKILDRNGIIVTPISASADICLSRR